MNSAVTLGALILFWVCLGLILYTYILYPVLLFIAYICSQARRDWHYLSGRLNRRAGSPRTEALPEVTLIIAAYNEEEHLREKISNLRELDYPFSKLEVIFVSDGSTDRTNEILLSLQDTNIRTLVVSERKGKPNALNLAVRASRSEILVLTDASTLFAPTAVRNLVRHFGDDTVGAVCGLLQFRGSEESEQTEGIYWRYESMLRVMEGRLGATLTASGAIYALRRRCFPFLSPDTLIEDFVVPMHAQKLGYRVLFDPEAVATEFAAPTVAGEFTRRVRIAIGSFRCLRELWRTPLSLAARVAFYSHKLLRWVLPFLLIGLLLSNLALWSSPVYRAFLVFQSLFYAWAGAGLLLRENLRRVRFGLVGYFLLAMHFAFLVGFVRFLMGRGEVTWQRSN